MRVKLPVRLAGLAEMVTVCTSATLVMVPVAANTTCTCRTGMTAVLTVASWDRVSSVLASTSAFPLWINASILEENVIRLRFVKATEAVAEMEYRFFSATEAVAALRTYASMVVVVVVACRVIGAWARRCGRHKTRHTVPTPTQATCMQENATYAVLIGETHGCVCSQQGAVGGEIGRPYRQEVDVPRHT